MTYRADFTCFSLSPIELESPGIALATARAGGVGVLDLEFCPPESFQAAAGTLTRLLDAIRPGQAVGLRLRVDQIALANTAGLLGGLAAVDDGWMILADWTPETLDRAVSDLRGVLDVASPPDATKRHILLEITALNQLTHVTEQVSIDGLLARGQEAGGWCGDESTFVLAQGVLARTTRPVYVQGAIGPHTASACRAVGAAGVVLDDALWHMPESPLPRSWQRLLDGCTGQDSWLLGGGDGGRTLRVLKRPGWTGVERLRELSERTPDWRRESRALLGWGSPQERAWPIGQGIGEAARLQTRYRTTGRLVRAIFTDSEQALRRVHAKAQLRADGPLAQALGTRYPIVQGPMTRVSDRTDFAAAVAEAGALPMVALALLGADSVESLLAETAERLGSRSWGVGLLGFAPHDLLESQIAVVTRFRPRFALIAGGRPDQAARLEQLGIQTWLHVPTPALARLYIEQGARRLIFEGRECGGHVGPLGGFALWEGVVATLMDSVPDALAPELQLLFAGGIHDARSARMIEALASPLTERGVSIGVLMGTAYLFTREAVECGAITAGFQHEALACQRTVDLETGPGHASRCAITPFVSTFAETARALRAEGRAPTEISQALDALCLGRLRLAAKGLTRKGERLVAVDAETQRRDGMYMIGQIAALRDQVTDMASLHLELCKPSEAFVAAPPVTVEPAQPSDIAIIGIGVILPRANSAAEFWQNLLDQVDAITEIPPARWDWTLYYDADPRARDRVYSKWGCFIDEVPFDPARFGIPPKSLPAIDPIQLLSLEAVRRALDDAGYLNGQFDREHTSVILGHSGGLGELGEHYVTRAELIARLAAPDPALLANLPDWTEDSFPGILPNVAAGRVANRFDLGGANFTVDAACASSLTAIDVAVAQLESGRCNLAIAGGVDTKLSPFGYLCFSKTPALTPRERARPFDASADGIMLGEGVAMVVLKRLAEAEADGDHIYAVIKAVASSSDGKALGLTAPRDEGQRRAFTRAYRKAGIDPASIGFYEAHGTGTRLGDETETLSIGRFLIEHGATARSCVIGSHKALIGHTKATAGVSALIKTAQALHYRVLPPQPNVEQPLASLREPSSPLALLQMPHPWLQSGETPRRAGVSAFGFGGANCHCVLEEYRGRTRPVAPGSLQWPCELILLAASDRAAFAREASQLRQRLADTRMSLRAFAADCAETLDERLTWRGAIVARDSAELDAALERIEHHLAGRDTSPLPPHIQLTTDPSEPGALAMLFPGQGAQSLGMAREVALLCESMRLAFETADRVLASHLPQPLSWLIWPRGLWSEEERTAATAALTATEIAQPALGCIESGYLGLLETLGIRPAMVAGHSYGEYMALAAAGVLAHADLLRLSRERGLAMAAAGGDGAMAAVSARREILEPLLAGSGVVLANHNAPEQSVLSGPRTALETLLEQLSARGLAVRPLAVSGAFHSPAIAASQAHLTAAIEAVTLARPRIPVYSNIDARPYPDDPHAIRAQLTRHLLSPVEFVAQIEAMYAAGARCFLEVGPRTILSGLVERILGERPHRTLAVDGQGGGLRGLLIALAGLFALGHALDARPLFAGRLSQSERRISPDADQAQWLVSGGSVRRRDQAPRSMEPVRLADAQSIRSTDSARTTLTMTEPSRPSLTSTFVESTPSSSTSPSPDAALAAWTAYQETMRKFLEVQEQVMARFLVGGAPSYIPESNASSVEVAVSREHSRPRLETLASAPSSCNQLQASSDVAIHASNPTPAPSLETASANRLDRAGLIAQLLAVVSDCTGYPPEMLGLDQALEAELGIDSIKRVEILAGIERLLPAPLAEAMRARMSDISRAATLNALADALLQLDAALDPESVTQDASTVDAPANQTPELDREGLIAQLVAVVSDCTGYPPEMLGLDQALEAELGIDSIKRVEILAGIERVLPAALAEAMRARMSDISRAATLNALAEALLKLQDAGQDALSAASIAAEREPRAPVETEAEIPLDRFLMHARPAPLPPRRVPVSEGLVLVTGEGVDVATELVERLQQLGLAAALLPETALSSSQTLETTLDRLRERHGPVVHLIHLAGLTASALPEDLADWRAASERQVKQLFRLLRACAGDLRARHGRVISASLLGGAFGRHGQCGPGLPLAAGNLGMLRTLQLEWPEIRARMVDFAPSADEVLVETLLDELFAEDEASEIGYHAGQRQVWEAVRVPLAPQGPTQPNQPSADWVVLALGGARGITARVLQELLVPGMTLVILGRSPEPAEEEPTTRALDDPEALRRYFIEAARQRGEQATPVAIERRLRQLLRAREIRANLAAFAEAGARIEYHAIDVQDGASLVGTLDQLYRRHGRINALVQGVGVIEDKLLTDKEPASFDRVFDTKVDSTYLLCRHLRPDSLKLALLFASVAGRTGNRGQCDYASANEVINRFAWWMRKHWPATRVLSINWGPWAAGMASEAVNRQFRARGVIPIEPAAGCRFVREELAHGQPDDVELIAGRFVDPRGVPEVTPLLGRARPTADAEGNRVLDYRFSLDRDRYLDDHRLDGVPVVPAAVAMELLAEFVQAGWPEQPLTEVRDLRVLRGITLSEDAPRDVRLWARLANQIDTGHLEVTAEIRDTATDHPGYRATLILGTSARPAPSAPPAPLTNGHRLEAQRAYGEHCFHGPHFQRLHGALTIDATGVDGDVMASDPGAWITDSPAGANWLLDPGVVDALLQSAILWARLERNSYPLPSRFRQVVRYGALSPGQQLRFTNRMVRCTEHLLEEDFMVLDATGRVLLELRGIEASHNAALNRLAPSAGRSRDVASTLDSSFHKV